MKSHSRAPPHVLLTIGFVLLGSSALAFLLTQITHHQPLQRRTPSYRVTAVFDDVGQLRVGAPVSVSGVNIGQVRGVILGTASRKAIVVMDMDARFNQIPRDSEASINTQSVLGSQFIRISTGGSSSYLEDGDRLPSTHSAMSIDSILNGLLTTKKK